MPDIPYSSAIEAAVASDIEPSAPADESLPLAFWRLYQSWVQNNRAVRFAADDAIAADASRSGGHGV